MKIRCELWVRLKVVDLVSQTAWITLTEKLRYGEVLKGLNHYQYWGMELEEGSVEKALEEVDRVIQLDSAFTNQNKHLYRLLAMESGTYREGCRKRGRDMQSVASFLGAGEEIFSRGTLPIEREYPGVVRGNGAAAAGREYADIEGGAGKVYTFDCLVRSLHGEGELSYMSRLNERLNGVRVTDIVAGEVWRITLLAGDLESASEEIDRMVVTRSRREGLLLNPHYQRYEVIAVAGD